jgi:beta-phosphoglucomutase
MNEIKGILFDLDGTLVESKLYHYHAFAKALLDYDIELSLEYHSNNLEGLPSIEKLYILEEDYPVLKTHREEILKNKQELTREFIETDISENPLLINFFKGINPNIRIGLCSNAKGETVHLILGKLNLLKQFEILLSRDDVKKGKPDPEIYIKGMELLNLKPEETLIFEDSPRGVESAERSGAIVYEVSSPEDFNPELLSELKIGK